MKKTQPTFAGLLNEFGYRYDLRTVFDDFLTMAICAFSQNPATGKSYDEDLYMQTIEPYKKDDLRHHFPKMLGCLTTEMETRLGSNDGSDVLGGFYQHHLYRKSNSQYFTPWIVCALMAKMTCQKPESNDQPIRVLDPCCGSGRMLLNAGKELGPSHEYYGIDTDHTCVKMTVINLFLHGMFHSEVMCGDACDPNDFRGSYRTSFLPFGIFRVMERERSPLWLMHRNAFETEKAAEEKPEIKFEDSKEKKTFGLQLTFF